MKKFLLWWRTRPWGIRYGIQTASVIAAFYGFENTRAHFAWKMHQHSGVGHVLKPELPESWNDPDPDSTFEDSLFLLGVTMDASSPRSLVLEELPGFSLNHGSCLTRDGGISSEEFPFENCFPESSPAFSRKQAATRILALTDRWTMELKSFEEAAEIPPGPPILPATPSLDSLLESFGRELRVSQFVGYIQVVTLRARAHLALGDPETALREVITLLQFSRNIAHRGSLSGATLAIAMSLRVREVVWLGLKNRSWDRDQLRRLALELDSIDHAAWMRWAFRAEGERFLPLLMQFDSNPVQRFRLSREWEFQSLTPRFAVSYLPKSLEKIPSIFLATATAAMPQGWVRQNAIHYCQGLDYMVLIVSNDDPNQREKLGERLTRHLETPVSPYTFLTETLLLGMGAYSSSVSRTEVHARLMRIAVGLEIHRIDRGRYPQNLSSLAGTFHKRTLIDPFSGKPFRYRVNPDGQILLYSLGTNQFDDGGVANLKGGDLDIVWRYTRQPIPTNLKQ